MAGSVPDWRQYAKGAHHWVDEVAALERELGTLKAECEALISVSADPSALIVDFAKKVRVFNAMAEDVVRERNMLDRWIASETKGFFRQSTAGQFRAQFAEQCEIYGMLNGAMIESLEYWNQELAKLGKQR